MIKKRAQVGVEYLIIIGFVTFSIMGILVLANLYTGIVNDKIRVNQLETFSVQLVNHAESVFFAGEPSITTVKLSLPQGVENIQVDSTGILTSLSTSSGINTRFFDSKVPLQGSVGSGEGAHIITIEAKANFVLISEGG